MLSTKKPLYHASGCSYAFCWTNAAGASGRNRTRNPRFTKPLRYRCATLAKPRPAVYHTWTRQLPPGRLSGFETFFTKPDKSAPAAIVWSTPPSRTTPYSPAPRTIASSLARVLASSLSAIVRFSFAARRARARRSSSTSTLSAANARDERLATPPPKTVA